MNNSRIHLYRTLAEICTDKERIRRIVTGTELDASQLNFNSDALSVWHQVLEQANNQGNDSFYNLLGTLKQEFKRLAKITTAIDACLIEDGIAPKDFFPPTKPGKKAAPGFQWDELFRAVVLIAILPILLCTILFVSNLLTWVTLGTTLFIAFIASFIVKIEEWSSKTEIIYSWIIIGALAILPISYLLQSGSPPHDQPPKTPSAVTEEAPTSTKTLEPPGPGVLETRLTITSTVLPTNVTPSETASTPSPPSPVPSVQVPTPDPTILKILGNAGVLTGGDDPKLIVGVRFDTPPYGYDSNLLEEDCDPSQPLDRFDPEGYDIDIAHQLAEDWLNNRDAVEFRCVPKDQRQSLINDGSIKLGIFAFSRNDKRCAARSEAPDDRVWCSEPYMLDGYGILTYSDNSDINILCNVINQKVVVSNNTTAADDFQTNTQTFCGGQANVTQSGNERSVLLNDVAGKIYSAYVTDAEITTSLANSDNRLKPIPGKLGPLVELVIAVTPNQRDLLNLVDNTLLEWKNKNNDEKIILQTLMEGAALTCINRYPENLCGLIPISDIVPKFTVESGDTLSSISLLLWGRLDLWKCIAEANDIDVRQPIIKNGTELTIPARNTCPE